MTATATLDTDRFRKVWTLIDRGATKGERDAARARATDMAKSAGMTLRQAKQASTKAHFTGTATSTHSPAQSAADAFNDFFNGPEMRASRAAQDAKQQARRREILARCGTVEAVYAETERETALRAACKLLMTPDPRPGYEANYTLGGWKLFDGRDKLPAGAKEAVRQAWPLPASVTEAWAEFAEADALEGDRHAMHDYEHHPDLWVEARRYVLEELLDGLPAMSFADMLARQSWIEWRLNIDFSLDDRLAATMRADIERMAAQAEFSDAVSDSSRGGVLRERRKSPAPEVSAETGENPAAVQNERDGKDTHTVRTPVTASDRRRAVLAMIHDPDTAGLSDREIARRIGVSPQTVSTWRRKAMEISQ